jgi:hypothetical protein
MNSPLPLANTVVRGIVSAAFAEDFFGFYTPHISQILLTNEEQATSGKGHRKLPFS